MAINLERLPNGAIKYQRDSEQPKYYSNLTSVAIMTVSTTTISVNFDDQSITLPYADIGTINGAAKPATIELTAKLLAEGVFYFGSNGIQWSDTSWQPVSGKVAVFSEQGLLSTGTPLFPENAVPLVLLDIRIPEPPATGNYRLISVNGVVSWATE